MHGDSAILISHDPSPERRLWASVLLRALDDAMGLAEGRQWHLEMQRSLEWLGTKDYRAVCEMAGCDPVAVEERFRAGDYCANRLEQHPDARRTLKARGIRA